MNKLALLILALVMVSSAAAYPTVQIIEKQTQPTITVISHPTSTISDAAYYQAAQEAYVQGYQDGRYHRITYRYENCLPLGGYDAARAYGSCQQVQHKVNNNYYTPFYYDPSFNSYNYWYYS